MGGGGEKTSEIILKNFRIAEMSQRQHIENPNLDFFRFDDYLMIL